MTYKINTPYKRRSLSGGLIISRNNQENSEYIIAEDPNKYKVVSYSQYGYGCIGYASTSYFVDLKAARVFLIALCNKVIHENLGLNYIKRFTN